MSKDLNIEVPTVSNSKILKIYDTSIWGEPLIGSIFLSITCPGFSNSVTFQVKKGFDRLFNGSSLMIHPVSNVADLAPLPDGIYVIRLINEDDFSEFNHLRQTQLNNLWFKALCKLQLSSNDNRTKEIEKEITYLYKIKSYIDAAKAKVEFCNSPNEGLDLHNYAYKLLNDFNTHCKSC